MDAPVLVATCVECDPSPETMRWLEALQSGCWLYPSFFAASLKPT
jgi:hypothetical protein